MSFPDRDVQILMFTHDYGSMDKERIWQTALTRALDLPEPALPAGMNGSTALTRADAAVLVNRLLGRTPDRRALEPLSYDLLLDMPRTDARYEDVLEAFLSVSCEHYGSTSKFRAQTHNPAKRLQV